VDLTIDPLYPIPTLMIRFSLLAAAVLALPLAAQQPDAKPASRPTLPEGWQTRLDRANANAAAIKFSTMAPGWHVTAGPSAIYWNAEHTGTGQYEVRSSMVLTKPSAHPEAYGLFFGGRNLDQDDQRYTYFLVRQDGKYLIKHRAGSETHTIVDWTAHPSVKAPEGQGSATNDLTVRVASDSVRFLVNGQQVNAFPRSAIADIDGQAGLRINHNLDVHVARLEVAKL
jgi:hypothetical protein